MKENIIMPRKIYGDISGNKYNRLTAIRKTKKNKFNQVQWLCKCECGTLTYSTATNLARGHKKSCGCLLKENQKNNKGVSNPNFKKGYSIIRGYKFLSGIPEYPSGKVLKALLTP